MIRFRQIDQMLGAVRRRIVENLPVADIAAAINQSRAMMKFDLLDAEQFKQTGREPICQSVTVRH